MACPDLGAGNDPEPLRLDFHQGPTFTNAFPYCAIWGVMICLGQGGLHSPELGQSTFKVLEYEY